jgi:hypothetical protein
MSKQFAASIFNVFHLGFRNKQLLLLLGGFCWGHHCKLLLEHIMSFESIIIFDGILFNKSLADRILASTWHRP